MCSRNDIDDLDDQLSEVTLKAFAARSGDNYGAVLCHKCRQQPAVVQQRINDIYCRACFMAAFDEQMRATIGKWRRTVAQSRSSPWQLPPPPLLLFSGSAAGLATLHVLTKQQQRHSVKKQQQCKLRQPKRWPCDVKVLCTSRLAETVLKRALTLLANDRVNGDALETNQITFYRCTSLEPLVVEEMTSSSGGDEGDDDQMSLDNCIKFVICGNELDQMNRGDASLLQSNLALHIAAACCRQLQCCHLLLPDQTGSQLAADVLAALAAGRGSQLQQVGAGAVSFSPAVQLLRPLSSLSNKQAALYIHHVGWMSAMEPRHVITSSIGRGGDVNDVISQFVCGLQTQFPSTETTIVRTAGKLAATDNSATCQLCRLPCQLADSGDICDAGPSALRATIVSQWASTQQNWSLPTSVPPSFSSKWLVAADEDRWRLCYACRTLGERVTQPIFDRFMTFLLKLDLGDGDNVGVSCTSE